MPTNDELAKRVKKLEANVAALQGAVYKLVSGAPVDPTDVPRPEVE